jgi:hypothetical protein
MGITERSRKSRSEDYSLTLHTVQILYLTSKTRLGRQKPELGARAVHPGYLNPRQFSLRNSSPETVPGTPIKAVPSEASGTKFLLFVPPIGHENCGKYLLARAGALIPPHLRVHG